MIRFCSTVFLLLSFCLNLKAQQVPDQSGKQGTMLVRKRKVAYIPMPELRDQSLKAALMELKMRGLQLDKVIRVPGKFENIVSKQLINGEPVKVGTLIDRKSKITLVVEEGEDIKE